MKPRGSFLSIFIVFLFLFSSCDQIKSIKKEVTGFFQKSKKSKKRKSPKERPRVEKKESPPELKTEERAKDLKPVEPPAPVPRSISVPITPLSHFGGLPTSIEVDQQYLYITFGRKLVLYNKALVQKGSLNLENPGEKIWSIQKGKERILYILEKENILEIIRVTSEGVASVLKSFQVEGSFSVSLVPPALAPDQKGGLTDSTHQIFVYLKDRIQVLNATDIKNIHVLYELPVAGVSQAYPLDDYLYISREGALDVANRSEQSIHSSIAIGAPFKILGHFVKNRITYLVLTFSSDGNNNQVTIQLMPLAQVEGGIADVGQSIQLTADRVSWDSKGSTILLLHQGQLALYDLNKNLEMIGFSILRV